MEAATGNVASLAGAAAEPELEADQNDGLRLAVAANFRAPLNELAVEFERNHGVALSLTFGSSGLLAAQIRQGAPFDAFFSADTMRPEALIGDGLAAAPVTVYARGRVALKTRAGALKTRAGALKTRAGALKTRAGVPSTPTPGLSRPETAPAASHAGARRIGIPNPKHAPYGAAAMQCLERLGVRGRFEDRLVFGNNVNQVDHFLESGALDLGFVALSQLVAGDAPIDSYWVCPAAFHAPIDQGAVVLRRSSHPRAARTLLRFMTRTDTQARLAQLGYLPGG